MSGTTRPKKANQKTWSGHPQEAAWKSSTLQPWAGSPPAHHSFWTSLSVIKTAQDAEEALVELPFLALHAY